MKANAGDSQAVLSINGVAKDMSIDHKPSMPGNELFNVDFSSESNDNVLFNLR